MKKIIPILLLALTCVGISKAQFVTIPDPGFVNWLNTNGFSQCLNGNQLDTTCNKVTSADSVAIWGGGPINSLEGIEYFDSVKVLIIDEQNLSVIPSLPNLLQKIICPYNLLTTLPTLPSSLRYLDCDSNQITSLPPLPDSLKVLFCFHNPLYTLPTLPPTLDSLNCMGNHLSSLPSLPNTLYMIDCSLNPIISLPPLPVSLEYLGCSYMPLTQLPSLPLTLKELYCYNDQLISLPSLPPSMDFVICSGNSQLSCLPELGQIWGLNFLNTGVTCIPNLGNVASSNPPLNTLPICNPFNNMGCGVFWTITGHAYFDSNNNCLNDAGDFISRYTKVQLFDSGNNLVQQVFTDWFGNYSFVLTSFDSFTLRIDTAAIPFPVVCPAIGYQTAVITPLDSFATNVDFGLQCPVAGFDIGTKILWAQSAVGNIAFFPGTNSNIYPRTGDLSNFQIPGVNCASGVSGSVEIITSGPSHYLSPQPGSMTPTSVNGDTILYQVGDFGNLSPSWPFGIVMKTDTTAQIGDTVCFNVVVNPLVGDNHPANNVYDRCFAVGAAYDPNEKEVNPSGNIDSTIDWLTYTIRFQNTGTAPAQYVYILDTLDPNLDVSTLQVVDYSHPNIITQQLEGGIVRFNFPNINLPDSSFDEPGSHGYVVYRIKLKDGLPIGTQIHNTAFIYFDYTSPIQTNIVSNTISLPQVDTSGDNIVEEINETLKISPNPCNGLITIQSPDEVNNLIVIDLLGRNRLELQGIHQRIFTVPLRGVTAGIYLIRVQTSHGEVMKKIVVK